MSSADSKFWRVAIDGVSLTYDCQMRPEAERVFRFLREFCPSERITLSCIYQSRKDLF